MNNATLAELRFIEYARSNGTLDNRWEKDKGYIKDEYELVEVEKRVRLIEEVSYVSIKNLGE